MMKKILFILPTAEYGSAATQLVLLARLLPRERFACRVCVLGGEGPVVRRLRAAGVAVDVLGWRRLLDGRPLWRLRQLMENYRPDCVHLWRPAALRAFTLACAARKRSLNGASVVMSAPCPLVPTPAWRTLDGWLFRHIDQVIASGEAEAASCRRVGLKHSQLTIVPPGVDLVQEPAEPLDAPFPIGPSVFCVACVGPLESHKGFYDALWAFDILRYLYNELHLLLIGTGGDRERLAQFMHNIGAADRVHWLGQPDDVRPWLHAADLVWAPSRSPGGVHAALEAMAAGTPVIATRLACLEEIIADGVTGLLVAPGDRAALARQTRVLLDDAPRRRRMGLDGQQRVHEHFAAVAMTHRFTQLYESLPRRRVS